MARNMAETMNRIFVYRRSSLEIDRSSMALLLCLNLPPLIVHETIIRPYGIEELLDASITCSFRSWDIRAFMQSTVYTLQRTAEALQILPVVNLRGSLHHHSFSPPLAMSPPSHLSPCRHLRLSSHLIIPLQPLQRHIHHLVSLFILPRNRHLTLI
jgi:hypothetical protein